MKVLGRGGEFGQSTYNAIVSYLTTRAAESAVSWRPHKVGDQRVRASFAKSGNAR